MNGKMVNVLIVGVGGQGVVLASNILCEVALQAGFDVKKSEIHGMSQRGGVVTSHIRFGEKVYSPLVANGQADALLAFEAAEALRWAHELNREGKLIVSTQRIKPPSGGGRRAALYPDNPVEQAQTVCRGTVIPVDAEKIALDLGNTKLVNTILLGALSTSLAIDEKVWQETIRKMVPPKTIDLNLEAFVRGKQAVS